MATVKSVSITETVTKKEFDKFLARDGHCLHCGATDETLIPQHRRNRGMGGSQSRSKPSNVIVLCSYFNGLIESQSGASMTAQRYGWKLRPGQEPENTPVYDSWSGEWYLLEDNYTRQTTKDKNELEIQGHTS